MKIILSSSFSHLGLRHPVMWAVTQIFLDASLIRLHLLFLFQFLMGMCTFISWWNGYLFFCNIMAPLFTTKGSIQYKLNHINCQKQLTSKTTYRTDDETVDSDTGEFSHHCKGRGWSWLLLWEMLDQFSEECVILNSIKQRYRSSLTALFH